MTWDASELQRRVEEWAEKVKEAAADALTEVAEQWLEEGNRLVPIEEGTLEGSGVTEVDRETLQAAVGWGAGASRDYAIVQHEDTSLRHNDGRSAKWGEIAGRKVAETAAEDIAASIKASLG